MRKYVEILKKSKLFDNINENDIENIINCLGAKEKKYSKDSYIYGLGDRISALNMVAEGEIHIVKEDYWGNLSILTEIGVGELFGETYACLKNIPLQVNVVAVKDCTVIEFDINKVINACSNYCKFHSRLIQNLLFVLANKNFMLTNKLEAMSQRSIRDKVMTYLSQQSRKNNSSSFEIPFNRQQLADYLAVDRSALSKEICKLRNEGILEFNKNYFELKKGESYEE